ncbi:mannitol dehydrogenase family protein [Glaciecola siphonariae]|uniref:Mannitol dehydrogenase family protein n=1 Tax=Glaciecola siphonariae TaxID=521012 RepID=A0ABV9LVT8_9ALTE
MTASHLPRLNRDIAACVDNALTSSLEKTRAPGIVHLGIGAFHRAHQAVYTQCAMELEGGDWHIIGVSLRSETVAKQLNPQDGLYTVVERDDSGSKHSIIRAVNQVLVAPEAPEKVLDAMCSSNIKVISLTVTEKGYCYHGANADLHLEHEDIVHDLAHLNRPRSAIGFLVSAIKRRISLHLPPLTIISCDNLPNNGSLLKQMVLSFAQQIDKELARRIASDYRFPSTMVDRMVPASTPDDLSVYAEQLGYTDQGMVLTEPFTHWVIEDSFAGPIPAWQAAGAIITKDVHAFEKMKLRLLNGCHSAIAYIGFLASKRYVSDVMQSPMLADFVLHLMHHEILPSVEAPEGVDIRQYCKELLQRFSNPKLQHSCYQVAMDGSQKLPQRLLNALQYQLTHQGICAGISFVIAAWMQYTSGRDLHNAPIAVQDPLAKPLSELASDNVQEWVLNMLAFDAVFPKNLAYNARLVSEICGWLRRIRDDKNIELSIAALLKEIS